MPHGEEYEVAEHSCKVGSGRVGRRSYSDEDVDVVMAAVVAHIRHTRTDYDDRLRNRQSWEDRDDIRHEVGDKIAKIVRQWQGKEDEE